MSLTANLPRGGNSAKGSTHMGLLGSSLPMAASPDLMNLGASSVDLPVRLSTLHDLGELASNVGGVAVEHWGVAVGHLSGVIQHDDLGGEVGDTGGRLVLGVGGDVPC